MATRKHESANDKLKERLQEEFLSCKICFEPLKRPKALPCLHSFCLHCLKGYVHRNPANQPGYFNCPMCRKGTRVPPGGVDAFQDNFLLLSLADTIQDQQRQQQQQEQLPPDCSCGSSSSGCSVGGCSSCSSSSNGNYWEPPPPSQPPPPPPAPPSSLLTSTTGNNNNNHHHHHHHHQLVLSPSPLFDTSSSIDGSSSGFNTISSTSSWGSSCSSGSTGSSSIGGGGGGNSNSSSSIRRRQTHRHHHPQQQQQQQFLQQHPQIRRSHSSSHRLLRDSSSTSSSSTLSSSSHLHSQFLGDDDDDDDRDFDEDDNNSLTDFHNKQLQHQQHLHHHHHHQQHQQQSLHDTGLLPPKCLCPPSPRELRNRQNDWYFGKVSRNASEEWLLAPDYPKGTFLIRHGEMSPDTYTLSVRDCDELRGYVVKHYKILTRRNEDTMKECYFIIKSRRFPSLSELVKHYQESVDGLCCKLLSTCAKPRSLIWAMERGKEDEYRMTRNTVLSSMVKLLGSGQFACVWLAKYQGSTDVAVKIQNSNCVTTAAFLDEAQILKTLQHPNIIELRGVCCEHEPIYLLLEYMPKGQLSKYLREAGTTLEVSQLVYVGAQIADAMAYMEKERFVHRNLGARNILVGENDKVKVAGFGMTKAVDDPDFNFRRGLKMAIKWMAPEVLLYNKYSTKADVWSFGVVLMEIFSLGKEPYEDKTSKEAFESVKDGFRMEKPELCPMAVYDVVLMCWLLNAHSRPTFDFLNTFLHDFQS